MILYRDSIIGNENALANSKKHDPPLRNFYFKFVQSTVPYRTIVRRMMWVRTCVRDSTAEVCGKNRDTNDAHAHVTYQAPITGLHSPTLLPFLQNSTDYLMLAQYCKFGVTCCFIGLTHPAVCTRARVCASDFWTCQTPPFNPLHQKRVSFAGLELKIPMICLQFRGNALVKFCRGDPNN
jgi:hypothetical protein